ncbi:MAG: hypothetical protein ABUS57_02385 [Pseudomonadota bacterium]
MQFEKLGDIHLRRGGGGGDPTRGMCVMELVSKLDGYTVLTDHPKSACPALTTYAITLNDSASTQAMRDTLTPLALVLSGSRGADRIGVRATYLAHETAVRILSKVDSEVSARLLRDLWAAAADLRDPQRRETAATTLLFEVVELLNAALRSSKARRGGMTRADHWREARAILSEAVAIGQPDAKAGKKKTKISVKLAA